jgi:hypothetical protein
MEQTMEKRVLCLARLARAAAEYVVGAIRILISVIGPVTAGTEETTSLDADVSETE